VDGALPWRAAYGKSNDDDQGENGNGKYEGKNAVGDSRCWSYVSIDRPRLAMPSTRRLVLHIFGFFDARPPHVGI
jgi:hypothetical protein